MTAEVHDADYQQLVDATTDSTLRLIIGIHQHAFGERTANGAPILQGVTAGLLRFMAEATPMSDAAIHAFFERELAEILPQIRMFLATPGQVEGHA